ncbi:hypothetical protein EU803_02640 [Loktanella sp. IMCC34160]|nr:hypothetical protein EU803_02640 [Loktanella sp. IMCC34160]
MDRYLHDVAVTRCFSFLNGAERDIPKKLRRFEFPAHNAFKATRTLRQDPKSRPGNLLKRALQNKLHSITFQSSNGVGEFAQLIGEKDFWRRVRDDMNGQRSVEEVQAQLNRIVERRNCIVHEADLYKQVKARKYALRDIDRAFADESVFFIKEFVGAIERVLS